MSVLDDTAKGWIMSNVKFFLRPHHIGHKSLGAASSHTNVISRIFEDMIFNIFFSDSWYTRVVICKCVTIFTVLIWDYYWVQWQGRKLYHMQPFQHVLEIWRTGVSEYFWTFSSNIVTILCISCSTCWMLLFSLIWGWRPTWLIKPLVEPQV